MLRSDALDLREAGAVDGEDVSHSVENFFSLVKAISRRLEASKRFKGQ